MAKIGNISPWPMMRFPIIEHGLSIENTSKPSKLRPTERVYEMLRRDLVAQKFGLGQRLMINELANPYYVSITPVREALSRLRGERLIGFEPGQGYYREIPHLKELQDLYALLEGLLSFSLRQSASSRQEHDDVAWKPDRNPTFDCEINLKPDVPAFERAQLIESVLQKIATLCNNEEVLYIIRNSLARTHFMRKAILEHSGEAGLIVTKLQSLIGTLKLNDFRTSEILLHNYLELEFRPLPELLRDLIALPYLLRRREPEVCP